MSEKGGFLGLGAAGGAAAGAGVIAVAVGILYATGFLAPEQAEPVAAVPQSSVTAETETEPAEATPEPETETADTKPTDDTGGEPVAEPEETGISEPETPAPLTAPSFDVVRASPDGTTLIAGKGAPGSTIFILVDGTVEDTQTADASGEFVSFLSLSTSASARVLSLTATLEDQRAVSEDEIILAPTPATPDEEADDAPQVAAAQPEPDADTPAATQTDGETTSTAPIASAEGDETQADAESSESTVIAAAPAAPEPSSEPAAPAAPEIADTTETASAKSAAESETPEQAAVAPSVAGTPSAPGGSTPGASPDQPAAIAVLRADREGVELVQPASPDTGRAPEQIALDTIGYSPEGDVLLTGRSVPEAGIRVYLNNVAVADLQADGDGRWRGRLDGIEPGVYTLRLDALRANGSVLSRLETPFKRERPEVLSASTADTQTDGQTQPIRQVTVQRGDTLWAISRDRYGDGFLYVRVFEANRNTIRDPDLIYPGQIFTIPE